jgi:serine/threonine protein kinase
MSRAASDLIMEATYMSHMNHPHILPVRALPIHSLHAYDDGDYDGYFIIMDELSNTLSDEIQEWKRDVNIAPSITEKMDYALQIASALDYLHTFCNVVYRDLKPSNIGFDINTGTIQLFDFGLCREIPNTNTIGRTSTYDENCENEEMENDVYEMSGVGTRRYMAPEIINDGKYNCKVDVYSWSMLVSELITGMKPYVNYDIETHRVAVCQGGERPTIPFQLFPQWMPFVLHYTWCESITDRWTARQLSYYLSMVLNDETNSAEVVERRTPQYINPSILQDFPDSPVDVQRLNEIDIYPSNWLLLPNLPDLNDEKSQVCGNPVNISQIPTSRTKQEQRQSIDDESSGIQFISDSKSSDRSNNIQKYVTPQQQQQQQHPMTICSVNGNVEIVVRRQYHPEPAIVPRPLPFHQRRVNSCSLVRSN